MQPDSSHIRIGKGILAWVVIGWTRLLAGDPNNQAPTIAVVITNSHMKIVTVTLISPALHPPQSQQFSTYRHSPPAGVGSDLENCKHSTTRENSLLSLENNEFSTSSL